MEPGWYPDPSGDHEVRYHDGARWTADVATSGVRRVDPSPPPTDGDPSRSATLAMVFGIVSLTIGWIPFVSFVAVCFALVAVVVGLRRRDEAGSRGAALTGVVTGAAGLLVCIAGIWVSVLIVRSVLAFENPGAHEVTLVRCVEDDGLTVAEGEIENRENDQRSYTIVVDLDGDAGPETVSGEVDDVEPGERRSFAFDKDLRFDTLDCSIDDVTGPQPFGFEN